MPTKSIEIFPWSANFETGIEEIDKQHMVLVELINRLAFHLSDDSQSELLEEAFDELAQYAAYHFQCEEVIWERFFPVGQFLKGHKETHKSFVSTLSALKAEEEESTPLYEVTEHLLSFLVKWLAQHILDSDMRMAKVVLAMQSGLSLECAQKKTEKEMSGVLGVILDTTLKMYHHLCERTLALTREINKGKRTEQTLRHYSKIFTATHEGIIITDAKGVITEVNPAFSHISGYSHEDAIGKNPSFLSSGKQGPDFYNEMWGKLSSVGHWQGEIWNRKKSGELYAELLAISALRDEDNEVLSYVGVFSDITLSKNQQEELELIAHYDALTKLPNRVLFADRFIQAVAHSKRSDSLLAVCFLDLDNFKPINDNYGHHAGDQLLVEVAERIKANIREEDTVSRQGGDEFTLLLGELDSVHQCEALLKRITDTLAQPYKIGGETFGITASLGITIFPLDNSDPDTLMRHADQAMYQAKLMGKGCYKLFDSVQDRQLIQKNSHLDEIQQALLNDEFCLYYQPKVNMRTGDVYGVEALIRWQHPEKGLLSPVEFLPVIEETTLEILVGEWVIDSALKQFCLWKKLGIELEISVNIASHHMSSNCFMDKLAVSLSSYPLVNPAYLQLEILETSVLSDLGSINKIVNDCQDTLSINFALDDFGTGYSSLTHLRNLPAETLKIDQTFVQDMLDDPDDFNIIDGIISLADSFGRKVIAEGVETTEHGLMLLLMGCELAQGYGISRPMPAEDFPEWISNYVPNEAWLASGSHAFSKEESRTLRFKLAIEQWQKNFKVAIQSSSGGQSSWPIMDQKKCLCGSWIKREKHEYLFEETWLERLNCAHDKMHAIANDLKSQYFSSVDNLPNCEIDAINAVFLEINKIFNHHKPE